MVAVLSFVSLRLLNHYSGGWGEMAILLVGVYLVVWTLYFPCFTHCQGKHGCIKGHFFDDNFQQLVLLS